MIEGKASQTAYEQAFMRALESLAPKDRRVCDDPLAVEFMEERHRKALQRARTSKFWTKVWLSAWYRDPTGAKAEGVGRTRYIDDYLQAGIKSGVWQVVILGAGCDSRAYRLKELEQIKVFEVDHPDTQKSKIANVKRVLGHLPPWVSYVSVDFDKENLGERLLSIGYRRDAKTLFIWEGVTMYLTAEAVDRTLSFVVANSSEGSSIIFNYYYRSAVDSDCKWKWADRIKKRCKRVGEPITFGIEGEDIEEFLGARGFSQVERVTPTLLNGYCFQGPNSRRKVCPFIETVHAMVGSSE